MLYSEKYNFVYVAIPKTGSTTLQDQLCALDPSIKRNKVRAVNGSWVSMGTHATAREIRDTMGSKANDMKFIAFLRDPRAIVASKYFFYKKGRAAKFYGLFSSDRPSGHARYPLRSMKVLFAQLVPFTLWIRLYPLRAFTAYVMDPDGELLVDEIGLTEFLPEDAKAIVGNQGLDLSDHIFTSFNRTSYNRGIVNDLSLESVVKKRLPEDFRLYEQVREKRFKTQINNKNSFTTPE